MINLSILICSLNSRKEKLQRLLHFLRESIGEHYEERIDERNYVIQKYIGKEIEIIICTDDKQMSVGEKRNLLVKLSNGYRVMFADDDDKLHRQYAPIINAACKSPTNPDVIVFDAARYHNGKFDRNVKYGIEYLADRNEPTCYYRLPNHLMCVKRDIALHVRFKTVNFGEDSDYAKRLKPLLKTQHRINDLLYEYWYDDKLSETANRR